VAVSIDGVQVPMKDGGRAEKRSQEDKKPVGPAGFREVGCGTISFHDRKGERLKTVRYGRMPETKKVTLKGQLEAELESIYASRPDLTLVCLSDGFEDHWEYLSGLSSRFVQKGEEKNEAIDLYHVLGRVKMALNAYHGEHTPESKCAFEQCRIWLREKENGAKRVLRQFRYCRGRVRGARRKAIDREITYFKNKMGRLAYKRLLERNLPVGSGVVEATCKSLVAQRMKRSGMSWRQEGGQAILTLRNLIQSDRWEAGWQIILQQFRRPVTSAG